MAGYLPFVEWLLITCHVLTAAVGILKLARGVSHLWVHMASLLDSSPFPRSHLSGAELCVGKAGTARWPQKAGPCTCLWNHPFPFSLLGLEWKRLTAEEERSWGTICSLFNMCLLIYFSLHQTKDKGFEFRWTWIEIPALWSKRFMTTGNLFTLSKSQFPHL